MQLMKEKRITLTLDSETATRAQAKAGERNMSLSQYISDVVRKDLRHSYEYEQALKRFLSEKPLGKKRPGDRYLTRDEVNDRARLRRR
jgi:hypothetical protein